MKENKRIINKNRLVIEEKLKKFLIFTENCIPIGEVRKELDKKWQEVNKQIKTAKNNK